MAALRKAGEPSARRWKFTPRRRRSTAAGVAPVPAAVRMSAAALARPVFSSVSLGGAATAIGFKVRSMVSWALLISASFAGWSAGTKLFSVWTLSTWGSFDSRATSGGVAARFGASTFRVLGVPCGSFIRSSRVEMDSVLVLRRCIGLKSKCSSGISAARDQRRADAGPDHQSCGGRA